MESVLSSVIWRFLGWLPPFLLKRIFSPEWLKNNIYIDIRPRHTSVEISQPNNPTVSIFLVLKNNTHFDVVIDRLILKFIYGAEMANPNHFKRELLRPGESRSLHVKGNIAHEQFQSLAFHHHHNSSHCRLEVLAECNSKLHDFCIEKTLEGIKPEIANEHLLNVAPTEVSS